MLAGARTARMEGRPAEALALLAGLRDAEDDQPSHAMERSMCRQALGDLPGAVEEVGLAVGLEPEDVALRVRAARRLVGLKAFAESERHAREALRLDPGATDALLALMEALIALRRGPEAAVVMRSIEGASVDRATRVRLRTRLVGALRTSGTDRAALDEAERLIDEAPELAAGWKMAGEVHIRFGALPRAVACLRQAVLLDPADATALHALLDLLVQQRDDEAGLALVIDGVARWPADPRLLDLRSELGARCQHPDAGGWAAAALAAGASDERHVVARWLLTGDLERVRAWLAEGEGAWRLAVRARLALWAGEAEAADALARAALAADPSLVSPAVVRVGAAVLRGRPEQALALSELLLVLKEPPRHDPLAEADELRAWRAEAGLALGHWAAARTEAMAAMTACRTYSPVAHLLRVLAVSQPRPGDPPDRAIDGYAWQPVAAQVGALIAEPEAMLSGRMADVHAAMRSALARLGGNRTSTPTVVGSGGLRRVWFGPHPRAHARRVQALMRTRTVDETLQALTALREAFPDDPIVRTYTAETLLWFGRHAEAEVFLREALARDAYTVWAWIGLGASRLYQGDADGAFETWAKGVETLGFEGPTLFVYRAEALWRAGRREEAAVDLDTALADKPHRLSAWLLRALVSSARGDRGPIERVVAELTQRCPVLWADAAELAGRPPEAAHAEAILEAALEGMRGNRGASIVTMFTRSGDLRFHSWGRWLRPDQVFPDFSPRRR